MTCLLLAPYQAIQAIYLLYTVSPESLVIKHTIFAVCFPAPNRKKPIDFENLFPCTAKWPNIGYFNVVTLSSIQSNTDCERNI